MRNNKLRKNQTFNSENNKTLTRLRTERNTSRFANRCLASRLSRNSAQIVRLSDFYDCKCSGTGLSLAVAQASGKFDWE